MAKVSIKDAFVELQTQVTEVFREADYLNVRRACFTQINAPNGAQLPQELVLKMQNAPGIDKLLDILACSPYWSWIDLRLLQVMVVASRSSQASQLLKNYKNALFPIKVNKILHDIPKIEIKEQYYSKVTSKIEANLNEMTVADLVEYMFQLEVVIMNIQGRSALAHLEKGCLEIHWYIPNKSVNRAFYSAVVNCHSFHKLKLRYIKIGTHPVITDQFYKRKLLKSSLPNSSSMHNIIIYRTYL